MSSCAGSFWESSAVNEWRHCRYSPAEFTEFLDLFLTLCPTQLTSRKSCGSLILRVHSFFPRPSFRYGFFAEGEILVCVYAHTHICMHTHWHKFSTYTVFQTDWKNAGLRWKCQSLRYLALIPDWYTVLHHVLLKLMFWIDIMNTPFIPLCADSSLDPSCNLWEHCAEPDKPEVLSSHQRRPTWTPWGRAALRTAGKAWSHQMLHCWWT